MIAGPAVLVGAGLNTGVSFAFDIADGHINTSWQSYLDSFAQGCMVAAITGPLGKQLGNCNSYASQFAANFAQQFSSSVLTDIMKGRLSIRSLNVRFLPETDGRVHFLILQETPE